MASRLCDDISILVCTSPYVTRRKSFYTLYSIFLIQQRIYFYTLNCVFLIQQIISFYIHYCVFLIQQRISLYTLYCILLIQQRAVLFPVYRHCVEINLCIGMIFTSNALRNMSTCYIKNRLCIVCYKWNYVIL